MCDEWYQNMDNGKMNGVFLDIRKAFDSVDHQILLHKIKTQFGLRNIEFDWFVSYLTNKEQVCNIKAVFRPQKRLKRGCRRDLFSGHFFSYFI